MSRPASASRGEAPAPGAGASIAIRHATRDDVRTVVAIEGLSFSDPWSRASFASLLGNPQVRFAVATDAASRELLGYVVAWFAADEAEIANLAVAPTARGRGIGAALLDVALSEADARGAVAVYLEVRESNVAAKALYASRGFAAVGRRRRYYQRPVEDALVLRRELRVAPLPMRSE